VFRAVLTCAVVATAFAVAGFGVRAHDARVAFAQEGAGQCGTLKLAPTMPRTVLFSGAVDGQGSVDCFAWQEFFYLNWRAKPGAAGVPDPTASAAQFGTPAVTKSRMTTTVWETYHSATELFPNPAYRNVPERPRPGVRVLAATSKFDGEAIDLNGIQQATSGWLTDQRHHLTFYEVRVDNGEFEYISTNHLNVPAAQRRCAQSKYGLLLPQGDGGLVGARSDHDCSGNARSYGENFGAIEMKAAWIPLPDPSAWPRYLTALADVYAPGLPPQKNVVVGLVGLHIIHKVPDQQQFNWATFEHVDNDPDAGASPLPGRPWTYNDPACNPQTDHYKCVPNTKPGTPCPSAAGAAPSAATCDPLDAPVQVTRVTPLDSFANGENAVVWKMIRKANPQSVFLHYQLVQVLWPTAGTVKVPPNSRVPLWQGSPRPRNAPVANTTLETYIQTKTCLYCHQYASIVSPGTAALGASRLIVIPAGGASAPNGASPTPAPPPGYASDFSFLFHKAR
jgi:hypothetical protein